MRRHIPLGLRVARASKGLRAAIEQKRMFHLWFHPTNLADESEAMFEGLDAILGEAARLREGSLLENLTMGGLVARVETARPPAQPA
jgi:hypothetical protein